MRPGENAFEYLDSDNMDDRRRLHNFIGGWVARDGGEGMEADVVNLKMGPESDRTKKQRCGGKEGDGAKQNWHVDGGSRGRGAGGRKRTHRGTSGCAKRGRGGKVLDSREDVIDRDERGIAQKGAFDPKAIAFTPWYQPDGRFQASRSRDGRENGKGGAHAWSWMS
jgi:hypothetical protein